MILIYIIIILIIIELALAKNDMNKNTRELIDAIDALQKSIENKYRDFE